MLGCILEKLARLDLDLSEHRLDLMVNSLAISLHEQVKEYRVTWLEILVTLVEGSKQGSNRATVH
jgi:hypothetical protein